MIGSFQINDILLIHILRLFVTLYALYYINKAAYFNFKKIFLNQDG